MTPRPASQRRERGSALFIAVMMLTMMGFLGLAALDRVTRDEQVAGYQNRARTAFYAAEAGIAEGRRIVREEIEPNDKNVLPPFPLQAVPRTLGDVGIFDREGGNLPRYYGDPSAEIAKERCDLNAATPICFARKGGDTSFETGGNKQAGKAKPEVALWHIGVVGESPDGSRARLAVLESKFMMLSNAYN